MGKTLGVKDIMKKNYKVFDIEEPWLSSVGLLSKPFSMLVFGLPKNGKTSFIMQLCKYMTKHGKVYYNSAEEGDSKTIQDALKFCKMTDTPDGKFVLGDRDTYPDMVSKLKKNRAVIVVIDSVDYMYLTADQFKELIKLFPNKSFIIISWEKARQPKSQAARDIRHMVGSVVHVRSFTAHIEGRYGGNEPFVIWDKKKPTSPQTQLF